MRVAAQLSKLYAALPDQQEYINIAPNLPVDTAVALVEKVLHEAKEMLPPVTEAIITLEGVSAKKPA